MPSNSCSNLSRVADYTYKKFVTRDFYKPTKKRLSISPLSLAKRTVKKILILLGVMKVNATPNYNFFWTNGLEAIALLHSSGSNKIDAQKELIAFYKESKDLPVEFVDTIVHSYVILKLQQRGVFGFDDLINRSYNFLKEKKLESEEGIVSYREGSKGLYFIDTLGMICPFLVLYGVKYNNEEAIDLSVNQMCDFLNNGFSDKYPFHAYDKHGMKYEKEGWGRGVGWMLMGMIDMLEYLPREHEKYSFIKSKFIFLIDNVIDKQRECGGFSWDLKKPDETIDQSVTSMVGYSVARAIELGILDNEYLKILKNIVNSIDSYTSLDGKVLQTSGECISLDNYSDEYGNYPWGQAPAAVTIQIYNELISKGPSLIFYTCSDVRH